MTWVWWWLGYLGQEARIGWLEHFAKKRWLVLVLRDAGKIE